MARINLAPNPSFKTDTTGWAAIDLETVTRSADTAFFGNYSLKVTNPGTSTYGVKTTNITGFTAGSAYTFSVYVYIPSLDLQTHYDDIRLEIEFFNSSDVSLSSYATDLHRVYDIDRWEDNRLAYSNVSAPAGVSYAVVKIISEEADVDSDHPFYVDALLIEQSSRLNQYFENLTSTPTSNPAKEQSREKELVNRALTRVPFPHITGPELNADISLGRLVFNTIDEDGTIWVCTDLVGWWGQSSPDVPDITRGTEDGSFDVSGRYMARVITLSGVFLPQSRSYLPQALERLITEIDLVRRTNLLRVDEDPTKIAYVRLVGQPVITTVNARGRTEFSITLRAADPIKYSWNDDEIHGNIIESVNGLVTSADGLSATKSQTVTNDGNASVTSQITLYGPVGSGTEIRALGRSRDERITLVSRLRDQGGVALATHYSRTNLLVTITTDADHGLVIGDTIKFDEENSPDYIDPTSQNYVVTAVSTESPYTFSYSLVGVDLVVNDLGNDIVETAISPNCLVKLCFADTLIIDTYTQEVSFNGNMEGQRSKLEPLIDWIKLDPGDTTISLTDNFDDYIVVNKTYSRSGTTATATIQFDKAHFMSVGSSVNVFLPESVDISSGSGVGSTDIVTINTATAHGYGVGDVVDVTITEIRNITQKAYTASTDTATLTLSASQSWSAGNTIDVSLPETASVATYSITSNVATITTGAANGFVTGDIVSISSPSQSLVASKRMVSGVATLTTSTAHKLVDGGDVSVNLPTTATLSNKSITGTTVTMTTTAPHYFIVGDRVEITLPTSATVDAFAFGGYATQLVTVTTTAAHGFSVGDKITTNFNSTYDAFDGTFYIESIPTTTTFTFYYFGTTSVAVSEDGAATGTITNVTNTELNSAGTAITGVPSSTTFTYTKAS